MDDLLRDAAARAIRYRRDVGNRPVWPKAAAVEALGQLDEALPATRNTMRPYSRSGTVWQGHTAMRISVSSWATTDDDVERSLAAMVRVAKEVRL